MLLRAGAPAFRIPPPFLVAPPPGDEAALSTGFLRSDLLAGRNGFAAAVGEALPSLGVPAARHWEERIVTSAADLIDALESTAALWITFAQSLDGADLILSRAANMRPHKVIDGRGRTCRIGGPGSNGIWYDGSVVGETANVIIAYCQLYAQVASANIDIVTFSKGFDLVWVHRNWWGPGGTRDSYIDFSRAGQYSEITATNTANHVLTLSRDVVQTGDVVKLGGNNAFTLPGTLLANHAYWAERVGPGQVRLYAEPARTTLMTYEGGGHAGTCYVARRHISRITIDWNLLEKNPGEVSYAAGERAVKGMLIGSNNASNPLSGPPYSYNSASMPNDQGVFRDCIRATHHHNWWRNIIMRAGPNADAGVVHAYDCLHEEWGDPAGVGSNAMGTEADATMIVEGSIFTPYTAGAEHWWSEYEPEPVLVTTPDLDAIIRQGASTVKKRTYLLWSRLGLENGARVDNLTSATNSRIQSYGATFDPATGQITTSADHDWTDGHPVEFTTTGALPAGVSAGVVYRARITGPNSLELYQGDNLEARIVFADAGGGTHTIRTARVVEPSDHYAYTATDSTNAGAREALRAAIRAGAGKTL